MQCGKLDGYGVGGGYGLDRLQVQIEVPRCVLGGARGLAEHVVGEAVRPARGAPRRGLRDGLGDDELAGEDAHRLAHRGAHHRLAEAGDEIFDGREVLVGGVVPARERAGEHEGPVGRARRAPVAGRKLVADQRIGGLRIGDAQQRLGDAHQRDTFARRKPVLPQERLGAQGPRRGGADTFSQVKGGCGYFS